NASSGDLDPYVALVSSDDVMLTSNDDVDLFAGNFNAAIIGYTIAETGSYSIIATRYDGENGASSGEFALSLYTSIASIPIDNPPAASSHLSYGEHIEGSIDDEHYAYTYTFNGNAGDIIS